MQRSPQMTIGGRQVPTTDTFEVINPATENAWIAALQCSQAQLDEAFAAAPAGQVGWAREEGRRRKALADMADALDQANDELALRFTREQAKPITSNLAAPR